MRKIENSNNWYSGYLRDIQIAQTELSLNIGFDPKDVLCDIYSLPSNNHQTFFCKVILENGFAKVIYAKAIQNSIWFSDPIYMYRFEEAKNFADHPVRRGRIFCGKKIIKQSAADRLMNMLNALESEQPDDLVDPCVDADFTAIRIYENGKCTSEILYTNAEKLRFKAAEEHSRFSDYMRELHLYVEAIIGIGIC